MTLALLHFAHVFLAAGWAGATLAFGLVIWPRLARMPVAQARAVFGAVKRPAAAGLGSIAGVTYLLGIARAIVGGGISAWSDILAPYGLVVIAAVILMATIESTGGRLRRNLARWLDDPAAFERNAPAAARRAGLLQLALMLALVGLMVTMGFGFV